MTTHTINFADFEKGCSSNAKEFWVPNPLDSECFRDYIIRGYLPSIDNMLDYLYSLLNNYDQEDRQVKTEIMGIKVMLALKENETI